MRKIFFLLFAVFVLPGLADRNGFVPQKDSLITTQKVKTLPWKTMGFCDSTSQICIYMDTVSGYIVQLRRLEKTRFSVRGVDIPVEIDELVEGAFLTSKFKKRKLKYKEKNLFNDVYEAKRGKMRIEVSQENSRIKNITIKK